MNWLWKNTILSWSRCQIKILQHIHSINQYNFCPIMWKKHIAFIPWKGWIHKTTLKCIYFSFKIKKHIFPFYNYNLCFYKKILNSTFRFETESWWVHGQEGLLLHRPDVLLTAGPPDTGHIKALGWTLARIKIRMKADLREEQLRGIPSRFNCFRNAFHKETLARFTSSLSSYFHRFTS